jgi:uncharacterized protein (DUF1501 family)
MISRRAFIKGTGLAMFGIGFGGVPSFLVKAAQAEQQSQKKKILVCIFQRGAMDGLMAVSPFNDQYLKTARPNIFVNDFIDLDGKFGLHPGFGSFESLFKEKRLAIVHGMGSPNTTRSHFDAQDYMESGTPFNKGTDSGWLNRAVGLLGHDATPYRAVSLTSSMPRSFYGQNPALAIRDLRDFNVQGKGSKTNMNVAAKSFEELYDETSSSLLKDTGKESFEAMRLLQKTNVNGYTPANEAVYPSTALGNSLKQIAQLIKMNVGLQIGFAEHGGWDTHFNQGAENGVFARNANDLSKSIVAFWTDLQDRQDDITILTMTEFGRTVKQNGTGGTDHGRASCSFILGKDVMGGKVYGDVKELAVENLEDGRDLPVTTDFRSVFSDVAGAHLELNNDRVLFPEWSGQRMAVIGE